MASGLVTLASCTVDLDGAQIHMDRGGTEALTELEHKLLTYLVERPGRVVTHAELLREVWGYRDGVATRAPSLALGRLRRKVERDPREPDHLVTVRGQGVRFEPLVDHGRSPTSAVQVVAPLLALERRLDGEDPAASVRMAAERAEEACRALPSLPPEQALHVGWVLANLCRYQGTDLPGTTWLDLAARLEGERATSAHAAHLSVMWRRGFIRDALGEGHRLLAERVPADDDHVREGHLDLLFEIIALEVLAGHHAEACRLGERALRVARRLLSHQLPMIEDRVATALSRSGEPRRAHHLFQDAIQRMTKLGWRRETARVQQNHGVFLFEQGALEEAETCLLPSAEALDRAENHTEAAMARCNLAAVALARGDAEAVVAIATRAREEGITLEVPRLEGLAWLQEGRARILLGDFGAARRCLERAAWMAEVHTMSREGWHAARHLGWIDLVQGHPSVARTRLASTHTTRPDGIHPVADAATWLWSAHAWPERSPEREEALQEAHAACTRSPLTLDQVLGIEPSRPGVWSTDVRLTHRLHEMLVH